MKPLTKLTDQNKSTYFSLLIYDITDKINNSCDEWFNKVFIDKVDYIPEEIYTGNLLRNLDYLFSQGIWMIEIGEREKYDIKDPKKFFVQLYEIYTNKKYGFKYLVHKEEYCASEHRLYTKKEIAQRKKAASKIAKEIWENLNKN